MPQLILAYQLHDAKPVTNFPLQYYTLEQGGTVIPRIDDHIWLPDKEVGGKTMHRVLTIVRSVDDSDPNGVTMDYIVHIGVTRIDILHRQEARRHDFD